MNRTMTIDPWAQKRGLIHLHAIFVKHQRAEGVRPGAGPFFSKLLQDVLGTSEASAARLARIARNLTEQHITVLAGAGATDNQVDSIAALGKGEAAEYAISLIVSKAEVDEAIKAAKTLNMDSVSLGQTTDA